MSTNYFSLKFNEDELMKKFCKYWKHAIWMYEMLNESFRWYHSEQKRDAFSDDILKLENQSNKMRAELIDDAIWAISKNQPHASHLRFVVAIISSSFDLERICDYANNIRKFLVLSDISDDYVLHIITNIMSLVTKKNSEIFLFFVKNSAIESYEFAKKQKTDFKNLFQKYVKKIKKIFNEISVDLFVELILVLKYIERTIDHVIDIVQKFVYIKKHNFFFNN